MVRERCGEMGGRIISWLPGIRHWKICSKSNGKHRKRGARLRSCWEPGCELEKSNFVLSALLWYCCGLLGWGRLTKVMKRKNRYRLGAEVAQSKWCYMAEIDRDALEWRKLCPWSSRAAVKCKTSFNSNLTVLIDEKLNINIFSNQIGITNSSLEWEMSSQRNARPRSLKSAHKNHIHRLQFTRCCFNRLWNWNR